jgi:F0F1-type ATP synthase assembly protein I
MRRSQDPTPRPDARRYGNTASNAALGLSLAFEFAGAVAMFWFVGKLVDGWLGSAPWGQVVGSILGWVGGILHVYYAVQRRQG